MSRIARRLLGTKAKQMEQKKQQEKQERYFAINHIFIGQLEKLSNDLAAERITGEQAAEKKRHLVASHRRQIDEITRGIPPRPTKPIYIKKVKKKLKAGVPPPSWQVVKIAKRRIYLENKIKVLQEEKGRIAVEWKKELENAKRELEEMS